MDLKDEDVVKSIQDFVRSSPDIEVYEYIRRGNNGEVYFGKRNKMGDDVVLKFYWSHSKYDASEEAVILKNVKHNNILEIYDLKFLPPNYAYFLTPKISGGDLQGIIDNKKISSKESLNIISGILLGLTELHSKHKLVHRDLKPGNILIKLENGQSVIADLGAVKKIEIATGHVTASKSTYLYLPPESILKNEYYFQSDIYQVGVILFQLLGGYFPVNDQLMWLSDRERKQWDKITRTVDKEKKFGEIIDQKIIKGTLASTSTLPYYLDPSFKKVLNKALHGNYKNRYQNPALFLKEIHQLQRKCPNYFEDDDKLLISHENGRQFMIYQNKKKEIVLEKKGSKGAWRKDNSHEGSLDLALSIARENK